MLRVVDDLVAAALLNDMPVEHHGDAIADVMYHRHVVTDEKVRELKLILKLGEQIEDLRLNRDIQRTGGLIADDQFGLQGERPGDADALALAAGELVREPFSRAWPKPAALKEIADTLPELIAAGQAVHLERFADDSSDAHSWIEGADRILEDDLHLAAQVAHFRP